MSGYQTDNVPNPSLLNPEPSTSRRIFCVGRRRPADPARPRGPWAQRVPDRAALHHGGPLRRRRAIAHGAHERAARTSATGGTWGWQMRLGSGDWDVEQLTW